MVKTKPSSRPLPRRLAVFSEPRSIVAEQYRTIRTNLNFAALDKPLKTLVFTSAVQAEGKSTTVSNLAVAFAEEGKRVLLIDADMRKPTVHLTFRLSNRLGLSSLLRGRSSLSGTVKKTDFSNLSVIPSGPVPTNPAELLASPEMEELIRELAPAYDVILFDSPPVLSVTDTRILANRCDGTVLVIHSGKTDKGLVKKTRDALSAAKAELAGTVLNNFKIESGQQYYRYDGTGY